MGNNSTSRQHKAKNYDKPEGIVSLFFIISYSVIQIPHLPIAEITYLRRARSVSSRHTVSSSQHLTFESENCSVMSDSLRPHRLYSPWNSLGLNTRVGSLFRLQGIVPTQGLNPGLRHCRQILSQLSHKGSPRILEWVIYPFSRGPFQPRNPTRVSCIAGRFFTN